ncbi:MAG: YgfZ/GcvT domain-containing protein [Alphaproteobacteria bacterium]|jgi:folate-binding protein YgfZ|nr:folate-binding protein [Alphaproteobacteria bacterium]
MMTPWIRLERTVIKVAGVDRFSFLQGLITQDLKKLAKNDALYGALLTPQGRFDHDFFVTEDADGYLLECEKDRVGALLTLLTRYRLRAKVSLEDLSDHYAVVACIEPSTPPQAADIVKLYQDPRLAQMGWRALVRLPFDASGDLSLYHTRRIQLGLPEGSLDMEVGKAIPLEYGLDLLNGIDWDKGCYLGQELTARTHYTGILRKTVVPVTIEGMPPAFKEDLYLHNTDPSAPRHAVGKMLSHQGAWGLVRLRLEVLDQENVILEGPDGARLTPQTPAWRKARG